MDFIIAKTIVNKVKNSGWFGIDYNMNIYKGCCHGCIYCDSRSRCYQIENFDTVRAKIDSTEIINRELKGKIKKGVVGTGAMSDPYNPYEKKYELTREALKLVDKYGYGIAIDTKSNLITRDIDILKSIKVHSPIITKITITTCNDKRLSPKYKNLLHIFKEECDKKNIIYNMEDIIEDYKNKYKTTQISLFD